MFNRMYGMEGVTLPFHTFSIKNRAPINGIGALFLCVELIYDANLCVG